MAMSLTEQAFIEEHIRSKQIPRIAVVLSRLDQVDKPDRLRVIQFTRSKLAEWAPEAELWLANEADIVPPEHNVSVVGCVQILAQISEWAMLGAFWRYLQVALNIFRLEVPFYQAEHTSMSLKTPNERLLSAFESCLHRAARCSLSELLQCSCFYVAPSSVNQIRSPGTFYTNYSSYEYTMSKLQTYV